MKLHLSKTAVKKPKIIARYQKQFAKKWKMIKKDLSRRFKFVGIWKKNTAKWFKRRGDSIVRVSPPWLRRVGRIIWRPFAYIIKRIKLLLARRPHRSFRLTKKRDYARSLKLPGYWSFTNSVRNTLWKNWRLFGGLVLAYVIVAFVFNSFGQQQAYQNLSDTLYATGGDLFDGHWGKIAGSSLLLITSVTNGLTPNVTSAQTFLGAMTVFFAWLATVWALRNIMAGRKKIKVRDAVYNSGAPVIPTVLVSLTLILQLLPLSLAILIYNAALASQFIDGVTAMLAWVIVALLAVLSIYWIVSTIIAMVVVTLPGMYPWRAIQVAGDLVVGRRLRIVLRMLWLAALVVITWALIVIPIILFDDWIKNVWSVISWVPIVPLSILIMSSITIIFSASYIYMLYRKIVDDDAAPA